MEDILDVNIRLKKIMINEKKNKMLIYNIRKKKDMEEKLMGESG